MEEVVVKYEAAINANSQLSVSLEKLEINIDSLDYKQYRDSVIKRFEFTIDALHKFLKAYLVAEHGFDEDIMSPRNIFRFSLDSQIVANNQFTSLIRAIEDRNRTSHTYNEELAEVVCQRIYDHEKVMRIILDRFILQGNKVVFQK